MAEDIECQNVTAQGSSYKDVACPVLGSVCVASKSRELTLLDQNSNVVDKLTLHIKGRQNQSDVGQYIVSYYFSKTDKKVTADLEHNSDGSYPYATEYPGFSRLTVSTGKKSSLPSVYYSQICFYELK